ncbi:MAG: hypothetical protein ABI877_02355 [Gemmatimonadaceae bacterium]
MTFRESSVRLLFNVLLVAAVSCRDDSAVAPTARQGAAEPSRAVAAALQAPASVSASPDTNAVSVVAAAVTGAASYHFYWSTTPGVVPSPANRIDSSNPYYSFTPLAPGSYYFVVAGVDGAGVEGPLSTEVYATVSRTIKLSRVSPTGLVTTDSVFVKVSATSFWQLASVTASVAGQQKALSFVAGYWQAWLPLPPGGPVATFLLTVTAVDVQGSTAALSISFVRDRPPTVAIQSPDDSTFSAGSVHLIATCTDDAPGGCIKLEVTLQLPPASTCTGGGTVIATGVGSIDETVSLAAYDGLTVCLQFFGSDVHGSTMVVHSVIVDLSPHLHLVANASGNILDFVPKRVLVRVTGNGRTELRIQDQTTSTTIWSSTTRTVPDGYGYLTPKGALFSATGTGADSIHEWRSGSLLNLGPGTSPVVKGAYAIWSAGSSSYFLKRRNLTTGVTTQTPTLAGNWQNDVAKNGVAAYWEPNTYSIYRFDGSTNIRLTNDPINVHNIFPRTDGTLFVYAKCSPFCHTSAVALHNGTTETLLTPTRFEQVQADLDYRVTNGWVGFTQYAGAAVQVFTRSPAGTIQQVSFFGIPCLMSELSSSGEVVFFCGNRQYRGAAGVPAIDIGAPHTPLFRAGGLYELVGRSLLKVN